MAEPTVPIGRQRKFREYSTKLSPGTVNKALNEEEDKEHHHHDHDDASHVVYEKLKRKKKKYKKVSKWIRRAVFAWAVFCVFYALVKLGPESGLLPAPYVELLMDFFDDLQDKAKEFVLRPLAHLAVAAAKLFDAGLIYADKYVFVAPSPNQLHVLAGTLYFICAPWQLLPGLKRNFGAFYNWTGRFSLLSGIALALSGLRLVTTETIDVTSAILGLLSAWSVVTAFMAFITKTKTEVHRKWVAHNLLSGVAIFTVRPVGEYLLVALHHILKEVVGPNVVGQVNAERAGLLVGALFWGFLIAHMVFVEVMLSFGEQKATVVTRTRTLSERPRSLSHVQKVAEPTVRQSPPARSPDQAED